MTKCLGWLLMLPLLCLLCLPARADANVHVQVAADGCPSAIQLRDALAPLLDTDTTITFDGDPTVGDASVRVRDDGASYVVAVNDTQREFTEDARDCVERARVAAVFIALNVQGEPEPKEPPQTPATTPTTTSEPSAQASHHALWVVRLLGVSSVAAGVSFTGGVGIGASIETHGWQFGVDAAWLVPITIDLKRSDDVTSSVKLTRVPWVLHVGHLLESGALRVGPRVGLALDLLQMRGQDVMRPQTETRLNVGALAGLDGRVQLSTHWRLLAQVSVSAFARAYELRIDPLGGIEHTPRVWFSGHLGLEWAIP